MYNVQICRITRFRTLDKRSSDYQAIRQSSFWKYEYYHRYERYEIPLT